jgi:hypothetical protein
MSGPVRTPSSYHLVFCVEQKAGNAVEFEDVKETVKVVFRDHLLESTAACLRKKAVIRINPDVK